MLRLSGERTVNEHQRLDEAVEEDNDFMYNNFIHMPKEGIKMVKPPRTRLKSAYARSNARRAAV